jgi:hypothetical protein
VRKLSGDDYARAQEVLDWPLREALVSFLNRARQEALEQYRHARLEWTNVAAFGGAGKPPDLPAILKERS